MKIIEIIPAIIADDLEEINEKIKKVEPYVDWVQLDVMDGKFVDNLTWNNPQELKNIINFKNSPNIEVHLMVQNPEEKIDEWIKSGAKRIIFHYEATSKQKEIIEKIKKAGLEVSIAVNPETAIKALDKFLKISSHKFQISGVLIMTVHPGRGGQDFLIETLGKIRDLRKKYNYVNIEADGGINLETSKKAIEAGANFLVSGSYIFKAQDIKKAINELKDIYVIG